jgi:anti-sigma factor RsiW
MECTAKNEEGAAILLEYAAGRLAPKTALEVEQHLQGCARCREAAELERRVWLALDEWEPMPVSAEFNRKLHARIAEEAQVSFWRRVWTGTGVQRNRWRMALAPGAVAGVAVLAAILMQSPPPSMPRPHPEPGVDGVELEQVEQTLEDMDMLRQLSSPPGSQNL